MENSITFGTLGTSSTNYFSSAIPSNGAPSLNFTAVGTGDSYETTSSNVTTSSNIIGFATTYTPEFTNFENQIFDTFDTDDFYGRAIDTNSKWGRRTEYYVSKSEKILRPGLSLKTKRITIG